MKAFAALLAAVLAGALAASVVVSQRASERRRREMAEARLAWETEKAALEAELTRRLQAAPTAAAAGSPTLAVPAPLPAPGAAAAALQRLLALQPDPSGPSPAVLRRMVRELEVLGDCGPSAVEPIRVFLAGSHDLRIPPAPAREAEPPTLESVLLSPRPALPPDPPLEYTVPPTLRVGLFGVLHRIGGDAAERVLAETLTRTSRGLEIATLTRLLDDLAPGKYRDLAVTAARDLVTSPPEEVRAEEFRETDAPSLYQILHRFRDRVFVSAATNLLVQPEGTLDRWILGYLGDALGEGCLPALALAWRQPQVTRLADRVALAGGALPFAGRQPEADALTREFLLDDRFPSGVRSLALQVLAGSAVPPIPAPALAEARLNLLRDLAPSLNPLDPALRRAHERAVESLRRVAQGGIPLPADEFTP